MNLNMSVEDNFSSYVDDKTGLAIFVESFDNHFFEVRMGSVVETVSMGSITAKNNEELNKGVLELVEDYKNNNNGYNAK